MRGTYCFWCGPPWFQRQSQCRVSMDTILGHDEEPIRVGDLGLIFEVTAGFELTIFCQKALARTLSHEPAGGF